MRLPLFFPIPQPFFSRQCPWSWKLLWARSSACWTYAQKNFDTFFPACKVLCLASCWACLAGRPQCQACKISYLPTFWKSVVRPRNHHALAEKTVTNQWPMQPLWKAYRLRFVPVWVLEMHVHVIFLWWVGLFDCSLTVPCQVRR